jgi:hypothetical protein
MNATVTKDKIGHVSGTDFHTNIQTTVKLVVIFAFVKIRVIGVEDKYFKIRSLVNLSRCRYINSNDNQQMFVKHIQMGNTYSQRIPAN